MGERANLKVLVTGGAGFLGSHVVPRFLELGHEVIVQDVISKDNAGKLDQKVMESIEYKWKSVADIDGKSLSGVDLVVHLASQADVPLANSSPRYTFQLNVDAMLSLLLAVREAQVPLITMSTENVYGSVPVDKLPATEEELLRPKNPYAASKVANEALCYSFASQYKLPIGVLRSSTLFGSNMRTKQVVAIFCRQALTNEAITIEGDGTQSRDFNYVSNMVKVITELVPSKLKPGFNVWNIGSGEELSIKQLVDTIISVTKSKSEIVYRPWRPGEEGRLSISIEKARRELNYVPSVTVRNGLSKLASWMDQR